MISGSRKRRSKRSWRRSRGERPPNWRTLVRNRTTPWRSPWPSDCDEGRTLGAKWRGLLEGVGDAEQGGFLERFADELDRDRQTAFAEPGADRDCRVARDIERHHKARLVEQI